MRRPVRWMPLAIALVAAGCTRPEGPRERAGAGAAGAGPDAITEAQGPELPLPSLPPSAERVVRRRVGRVGTFAQPTTAADLRGALQSDGGPRGVRFHSHTAQAAAALDASWLVVLARSGLWLVERETLAVRARLDTDAAGDVAVSPDHRLVAFGRCRAKDPCTLEIRTAPTFEPVASLPIDRPSRIRFSPEGSRLAVASTDRNSATVVDVPTRAIVSRFDESGDVNDAVLLPSGATIAYGTNSDETVVVEVASRQDVWRGRPLAPGGQPSQGRDQNAVAYDAAHDALYTGGNDDTVWWLSGLRSGHPRFLGAVVGVDNDVVDLGVLASGELVVGVASGSVQVFAHGIGKGPSRLATLGAPAPFVGWPARFDVAGSEIITVLGGHVLRWELDVPSLYPPPPPPSTGGCSPPPMAPFRPRTRTTQAPSFAWYGRDEWETIARADDVVLVETSSPWRVMRVAGPSVDPLDLEPEVLGHVEGFTRQALLKDGTLVITTSYVRDSGASVLYRLPPRGPLAAPVSLTGLDRYGHGVLVEADGARVAWQVNRDAYEIDASGERRLPRLAGLETLRWEPGAAAWSACASGCRPLQ